MKRNGKKQYTTPRGNYWWPYDSKHTILDLANERVPFANVGKDTTVFKPGSAPREIIGPEIGDVGGIPPAPGPYRPPAPYRRSAPRFDRGGPPPPMFNFCTKQKEPLAIDKKPAPEPNPLAEAVEMDTTSEPGTDVYQDPDELFQQQQSEYLPEHRPILRTDPIEDVQAIFPPTQPPLAQAGPVRITPAQLIEMQKNKGFKPEILGLRPATRPPGWYKRKEDPIASEMPKRFQQSPEEVVIEDEDEEEIEKPTAKQKGKSKMNYAAARQARMKEEQERQREAQEVLQEVYGGPAPPEEPQIMDVERARAEKRRAENDYARIMRPQPTMTQRPRGQPRKPYRPTSEPVIVEIPPEDFIPPPVPPVQPGRIAIEGPQNADEPQIHIPQAPRRQGPSRRAIRGFLPPQRIIAEDDDYEDIPEDIPEIRVGDLPAYQEEQPPPEPAPPPPRAPKAKRPFRMSARDAAEFKAFQARFYADIGQLTSRYRRIMKAENVADPVKHRVKAAMETYVSISLLNLVYIAHGLKPPFSRDDIVNFHEYALSGVNIVFYERTLAQNVTEALDLYEQATEKLINTANRQIYDSLNLAKKERERLLKI
jgi:hypothetical protein